MHLDALEEHLPSVLVRRPAAIPFVIVVTGGLVDAAQAMPLVQTGGKSGFTEFDSAELATFKPVDDVDVPDAGVYLALDIDAGPATLNIPPEEAAPSILREGRSFLTIDEGVAVLTHFPDALKELNAFSLLGSRCGDRRVPAMWTSRGAPRLGWCWAGAPHTWMGTASLATRVAAL